MTPSALLASARSLIEGAPDDAGLIDRCTIIKPTVGNEAGSLPGTKITDTTIATNVPLLYEERRRGTITEERLAHVTHELFLIASSVSRAITPIYKIVVAARGDTPQIIFERPVLLEETFGPLVHLGAKKYVPDFGN